MAESEPQSKKLKSEENDTLYFKDFLADKNNANLINKLRRLTSELNEGTSNLNVAFLRVKNSNALFAECFTRARVDVETFRDELGCIKLAPLALFFLKGLALMKDVLDETSPTVPEDEITRRALQDLLQFYTSYIHDCLVLAKNRGKTHLEREWLIRFVQHLLMPLAPQKNFIIDNSYGQHLDLNMCCSTKHPVNSALGDTSFGCVSGWHGPVDILITGKEVPLSVIEQQEDFEITSVYSDSTIEVKKDGHLNPQALSQVMAETIVFSFLQHKQSGDWSSCSLVPGIGITPEKFIVYLYDCVEDVLLEALPINLYADKETELLNFRAIVVLWMVLNYEQFCIEMPDDFKKYKAQFHEGLGPKFLDMYRKDVQKGCPVNLSDSVWHKPDWNDMLCDTTCDKYYSKYVPERRKLSLKET